MTNTENMKKITRKLKLQGEINNLRERSAHIFFLISPFSGQGRFQLNCIAKAPLGDLGGPGEKGLAVKQTGGGPAGTRTRSGPDHEQLGRGSLTVIHCGNCKIKQKRSIKNTDLLVGIPALLIRVSQINVNQLQSGCILDCTMRQPFLERTRKRQCRLAAHNPLLLIVIDRAKCVRKLRAP